MDIQSGQPISDDQELAKVLAGISADVGQAASITPTSLSDDDNSEIADDTSSDDSGSTDDTSSQFIEEPSPATTVPVSNQATNLEAIKNEALAELRPLVDKLNISPEEKFNTYLLIIRATDDKDLFGKAYEAARNIPDESARAEALLDVVREIDFLSNPQN